MLDPFKLHAVCLQAAAAGAEELLAWRGRFATREKKPRDLVTDADLASQQAVIQVIRRQFPGHVVIGEESGQRERLVEILAEPETAPHCWVVDPLDGTTNYVHDYPHYAVSVAVVERGRITAGAVLDPIRGECFSAIKGHGAWLNEERIQVSRVASLRESLVAVSFPAQLTDVSADLKSFLRAAPICQGIRRSGSAALNLAYVACGRLDAHWAHEIQPWDAAAGVLLVREGGGVVTGSTGEGYDLGAAHYLASSSTELHAELVELMGEGPGRT